MIDFKKYENKRPYDGTNRQTRDDWRAHIRQLEALFKADALEEVGLTDHPKANRIFDKAWQLGYWKVGHLDAYVGVLEELRDLAEIIK